MEEMEEIEEDEEEKAEEEGGGGGKRRVGECSAWLSEGRCSNAGRSGCAGTLCS